MGMFFGYSGKVGRLYAGGMDVDEIAEELGIGRETVRALIPGENSSNDDKEEEG